MATKPEANTFDGTVAARGGRQPDDAASGSARSRQVALH
jgi:hypothetical protein